MHLRTIATILSAVFIPITILVGVVTGAYLKTTNPKNIDITASLAYLGQTMTAVIVTAVLFTVIIAVLLGILYRRHHSFVQLRLPLLIFVANVAIIIAIGLTNNYTNQVQDQYLIDHNRPTLQEFFDALEKRKQ